MTAWFCDWAWLGDRAERHVRVVAVNGVIEQVAADEELAPGDVARSGLTLPGLADAHSHAFHRALRGRTHEAGGDFWSWREAMYEAAARLDPDGLRRLARAAFAEGVLAGITTVGEFHYLHHRPDGSPYDDPNAMGHALVAAAADAGVRLVLIDTCYLQAGIDGRALEPRQLRFGDGTVDRWAERVAALEAPHIAVAAHSVRAVERDGLEAIAAVALGHGWPRHLHLSEQPAESAACLAATGLTPAGLAAATGFLGPDCTAVHATHLTDADIDLLGGSGTSVCLCPTTERDLADGIGPAARLAAAGSPLCLGTDSRAVVDLFEEARAVELDERLVSGRRGLHAPADLLAAATTGGHRALGIDGGGTIAVGAPADLVTVDLDSPRLAGFDPEGAAAHIVFAATAADVSHVVVAGREVVRDGSHLLVDDVAAELRDEIGALNQRLR